MGRLGPYHPGMPYRREAIIVLDMWRALERVLAQITPGSDEEEELRAEAARLRNEYQRLMVEAEIHHRPAPPPFPKDPPPRPL